MAPHRALSARRRSGRLLECRPPRGHHTGYRGTSLIRNNPLLGPYSRARPSRGPSARRRSGCLLEWRPPGGTNDLLAPHIEHHTGDQCLLIEGHHTGSECRGPSARHRSDRLLECRPPGGHHTGGTDRLFPPWGAPHWPFPPQGKSVVPRGDAGSNKNSTLAFYLTTHRPVLSYEMC